VLIGDDGNRAMGPEYNQDGIAAEESVSGGKIKLTGDIGV